MKNERAFRFHVAYRNGYVETFPAYAPTFFLARAYVAQLLGVDPADVRPAERKVMGKEVGT